MVGVLGALLVYLIVRPWIAEGRTWDTGLSTASRQVAANLRPMSIKRIGVALEHGSGDAEVLSGALPIARANHARLVLIHVVDTPGVMMLGKESSSLHASSDEAYLDELVREVEDPGPRRGVYALLW